MNDIFEREAQIREKQDQHKKFGFETLLNSPSIRMIMSMIPKTEDHPEALEMLLRETFSQGFNCGAVNTTIDLLSHLMPKPNK